MNLLALAERVEAAQKPSRALDIAVWATTPGYRADIANARGMWPKDQTDEARTARERHYDNVWAPRYTASLDAALTLVPEGWSRSFVQFPEGNAEAGVLEFRVGSDGKLWRAAHYADSGRVKAATPALALTAAALRARHAAETGA